MACLFVVLDQELAGLEFVRVHDIQQLPPGSIIFLQILSVELLHIKLAINFMWMFQKREKSAEGINANTERCHAASEADDSKLALL